MQVNFQAQKYNTNFNGGFSTPVIRTVQRGTTMYIIHDIEYALSKGEGRKQAIKKAMSQKIARIYSVKYNKEYEGLPPAKVVELNNVKLGAELSEDALQSGGYTPNLIGGVSTVDDRFCVDPEVGSVKIKEFNRIVVDMIMYFLNLSK